MKIDLKGQNVDSNTPAHNIGVQNGRQIFVGWVHGDLVTFVEHNLACDFRNDTNLIELLCDTNTAAVNLPNVKLVLSFSKNIICGPNEW